MRKWVPAGLVIWAAGGLGLAIAYQVWFAALVGGFTILILTPIALRELGLRPLPVPRFTTAQQLVAALVFVVAPYTIWRILADAWYGVAISLPILAITSGWLIVVLRKQGWSG